MSRATLLKIHRWVGLALALLLCVQGLTGTLLVFREEIDRLAHPQLVVASAPSRVPMQQLVETVRAAAPEATVWVKGYRLTTTRSKGVTPRSSSWAR